MELWMLLLLHLYLVQCVSLPAPSNVSISSFNMEHTLSFLPDPDTPSNTHFLVEIVHLRKKSWRPVASCSELKAGQTCNLTRAFKDPFDYYHARVRAFTPTQKSNWTYSGRFQPLTDTVLGPPDMSVSGCGNCLLLQLRAPTTRWLQQLMDFNRHLIIHVKRTRDGSQFRLSLPYKEEIMILYLQSGVEYCVTVSLTTFFSSSSVSSKSHCAFTSPPLPRSSMHVVYGLLSAFCALGFLLTGLVVCNGHPSLSRTLTYFLLRGHRCRSAPPEESGQISATQQHIEGSADFVLVAHTSVWPVEGEDCGRAVKSNVSSGNVDV